jgi:rRNA maturation protein Nop10
MSEQIPITRSQTTASQTVPYLSTPAGEPVKQSFPTELIDLPSEGFFYPEGSPLSSGRLELKFMTAREEDILTSQNLIKKGVVLDELLKALIVDPNVKLDDLLLGDKNAIFVAARRLAYGDKYTVKIKCPKCEAESEITVNLADLKSRPFDFSGHTRGVNRFTFVTPVGKKTLTYRLLNSRDDAAIDAELKGLAKVQKTGAAPEVTTRLKYVITSVDGNEDRAVIKSYVDTMPSRDALELRRQMRENTPDIDLTFSYTCPECGHEERMAVPMGVDFFWPDARV